MSNYVDRTKQELQAQSKFAVSTAKDAVHSNAWLYPLKGIVYVGTHRNTWGPIIKALPPALALSVAVLGGVFFFLYLPQAAFLSIISFGPIGFVSAVPLCAVLELAMLDAVELTNYVTSAAACPRRTW
jgi:hypothetical protein